MTVIAGGNQAIAYSQRSRLRGRIGTTNYVPGYSIRTVSVYNRYSAASFPSTCPVGFSGESGLARGSVTLSVSPECLSFVSFLWQDKKDTPRRDRTIDDYKISIR